ncbi:MAG: hypothetical protein K0S07_245 [Chlamydiales bacterium]|jgi:hypothetical protein|nr:hypothetical protein [Chlamydiales bacterium]
MGDTSYADAYRNVDFSKQPGLYKIGKGEQGVLMAEPYKSQICPLWRFKTEEIARQSSEAIYARFQEYLEGQDFVGADMCRKFLMMGWTRARRYANHRTGRKYGQQEQVLAQEEDAMTSEKAKAAAIFRRRYLDAWNDPLYQKMYQAWPNK